MSRADRSRSDLDPLSRIFRDVRETVAEGAPWPRFPGFTVLGEVGAGAFGTVYRARDEKLDRDVALKVLPLDPEGGAARRFLEEARALARVHHPNVLAIHSVLEHEGLAALCTEHVDGKSLKAVVEEEGPLHPREAARIGADLCRALRAVHAAGIVHRDVKTSNVIRERGGRIVLADFGLGAFLDRGPAAPRPAGSPLFMSPEGLAGSPVDPRSDIYSLGVLLYNLASGRFPFEGDRLEELLAAIASGKATPIEERRPGLPPSLVRAVSRAIEIDPARRFGTAEEMEKALVDAAAEIEASGRSGRGKILRRSILAAACLAAIGAGAFFAFRGAGETSFEIEVALAGDDDRATFEVEADRAVHLYIVAEDRKGKKYLLFPAWEGERRGPLVPGERRRILDDRRESGGKGGKGWLLLMASVEPLGPLDDAVPRERPSPSAGRGGWTRLKPVSVRGLVRRIGEVSGKEIEDEEEEKELLADLAEDIGKRKGSRSARGIWIGKAPVRLPADDDDR